MTFSPAFKALSDAANSEFAKHGKLSNRTRKALGLSEMTHPVSDMEANIRRASLVFFRGEAGQKEMCHDEREAKKLLGVLAKPARFLVQCFLMTNGRAYCDWDFNFQTLAEAEKCCDAQMAPSDTSLVIGHHFECNKTAYCYVNCAILMRRKNGSYLEVEARVHPLQEMLSQKHEESGS